MFYEETKAQSVTLKITHQILICMCKTSVPLRGGYVPSPFYFYFAKSSYQVALADLRFTILLSQLPR